MIQGTRLYPESVSYNTRWFNTHGTGGPHPKPPPKEQLENLQSMLKWFPLSCGLCLFLISRNFETGLFCGFSLFIWLYISSYNEMRILRLQVPQAKKKARWAGSQKTRCEGNTKSGRRCRAKKKPGTDYCHQHQRQAPRPNAEARRNMEEWGPNE